MRWQRAPIRNRLLTNPAPTRISRGIVNSGRLGVYDIARAKPLEELGAFRVVGLIRLFHGVEVVEDAIALIETVYCRKVFVTVAEMVLTDLRRCVTQRKGPTEILGESQYRGEPPAYGP
jgi:hypothetical protein